MTLSMWIFILCPPPQLQTHYDTKHVDIYVYAPPPNYRHPHVDIYVYAPHPNYRHTMTLSMWIFMFMPPPPITDTL